MASQNKPSFTIVGATDKVKVIYKQMEILGGAIKWWREVGKERMQDTTLIVEMDETPKTVIINGNEYVEHGN